MSKSIHIVFQVLNFLSLPELSAHYELSPDEKLMLIFLAKYKGAKGICPRIRTLKKELQRSDRPIQKTLNRLREKKLILIDYIPGKASSYTLVLPLLELSTTPVAEDTPVVDDTPSPTTPHPRRAGHPSRGDAPRAGHARHPGRHAARRPDSGH